LIELYWVALKWQFWEEAHGPDALFINVHEALQLKGNARPK
jgi:hypothetical protein